MIATDRPVPALMNQIDRLIPAAVRSCPRQWQAARHLSMLAAITAVSAPLLTMMYHFLGFDAAGMVVLTGAIVMMVAPFTLNAGCSLPLARDLFIGALYALKIWLALNLGGVGAPTVPWFALCPMIALLIGGLRPGLAWTGIIVATLLALFVAERTGGAMQPYPVSDPALLALVSMLGLVLLGALIVALGAGVVSVERRSH
jgi:hypothetical protein